MPIEWRPISELASDRRDGRDILLWDEFGAVTASWSGNGWSIRHADELDEERALIEGATHWADINRPGDSSSGHHDPDQRIADLIRIHGIKLKKL